MPFSDFVILRSKPERKYIWLTGCGLTSIDTVIDEFEKPRLEARARRRLRMELDFDAVTAERNGIWDTSSTDNPGRSTSVQAAQLEMESWIKQSHI